MLPQLAVPRRRPTAGQSGGETQSSSADETLVGLGMWSAWSEADTVGAATDDDGDDAEEVVIAVGGVGGRVMLVRLEVSFIQVATSCTYTQHSRRICAVHPVARGCCESVCSLGTSRSPLSVCPCLTALDFPPDTPTATACRANEGNNQQAGPLLPVAAAGQCQCKYRRSSIRTRGGSNNFFVGVFCARRRGWEETF